MVYYLRIICAKRWVPEDGDSFEGIDGEAITTDLRCDDNEWSLYRLEGETLDQSKIERVAVKAAALMLHRLVFPVSIVAFTDGYLKGLGLSMKWSPRGDEGEVGSWHYDAKRVHYRHINKVAESIYQEVANGGRAVYKYSKERLLRLITHYPTDFIGNGEKDAMKRRKRSFQKVFTTLEDSPDYSKALTMFDKAIGKN